MILAVSVNLFAQVALHFDGTDDNATASAVLTQDDNFTMECWVKREEGNYWAHAMLIDFYKIGLSTSGSGATATLSYIINGSSGSSNAAVSAGVWTHIALKRDSGTYTLYKNGIPATTTQKGASGVTIGDLNLSRSSGETFTGGMDDARVWTIARTDSQILADYDNELTGSETGLAAYYKMNEGTPGGDNTSITQLIDATGNGKHATLNNFALTGSTSNYITGPTLEEPTGVTLSSFTAVYTNGSSLLEWTTQSESNNLGWNIYRSETELENAVQINGSLIIGTGTTTEPTEYEFYDDQELVVNNTYWYWLESVSFSGQTEIYSPISLTIPEQGDNPDIPEIISNIRNYPNPFSNNTEISFMMNEPADVKVTIYNIKGQEVIRLFNGYYSNEEFKISWDGKDENGNAVTFGIYTYIIKTGAEEYTGKMILMD